MAEQPASRLQEALRKKQQAQDDIKDAARKRAEEEAKANQGAPPSVAPSNPPRSV